MHHTRRIGHTRVSFDALVLPNRTHRHSQLSYAEARGQRKRTLMISITATGTFQHVCSVYRFSRSGGQSSRGTRAKSPWQPKPPCCCSRRVSTDWGEIVMQHGSCICTQSSTACFRARSQSTNGLDIYRRPRLLNRCVNGRSVAPRPAPLPTVCSSGLRSAVRCEVIY